MKGVIETLKFTDSNGEKYNLYPRTLIECISNQNGDSLEDTLQQYVDTQFSDTYADKTYVAEQIAASNHLIREIVTEIPTAETAKDNVIYMYKVDSASGNDVYQEYQLIGGEVVLVGDTSVDLSNYVQSEELDKILDGTIPVGDTLKLGGKGASEYVTETKLKDGSYGVVTENHYRSAIQCNTQNAWYRLCEIKIGGVGSPCLADFNIGKQWNSKGSGYTRLQIAFSSYLSGRCLLLESSGTQAFSKYRLIYDSSNSMCYLDGLYAFDTGEGVLLEIVGKSKWAVYGVSEVATIVNEAITSTQTKLHEFDVSNNLTPVNNVDLDNGTYPIGAAGRNGYIAYVKDGDYRSPSNIITGRIRIQLPVNLSLSRFRVSVNSYDWGQCDYYIGMNLSIKPAESFVGFNSPQAWSIGNLDRRELPVVFGHDANFTPYVLIGNDNTTWRMLSVAINDISGYGGVINTNGWKTSVTTDNSDITVVNTIEKPYSFLPKTGGTLNGVLTLKTVENMGDARIFKNHSSTVDKGWLIQDVGADGKYASFAVSSIDGFVVRYGNGSAGQILTAVNKPSGTYTGTGAARTIPTGGIGNICWIGTGWISLLVTANCAIIFHVSDTGAEILKVLAPNQIKFENGVLTISNDSTYYNYFNASGAVYNYQVL